MPSILNTDLAGVADGSVLHLFYQDDQGNISEAYSEDGSTWKVSPTTVGTGAVNGTPITAYDVDRDADYGQKQTIHVQYLVTADNVNGVKLVEKVKILPDGDWTIVSIPQNIENQPVNTTRLCSGTYDQVGGKWNPDGSQWVYFDSFPDAQPLLTEIRRTPQSPWHSETVLPEGFADSRPGTHLAASVKAQARITVLWQNHDGDIKYFFNLNNTWTDGGVIIPKEEADADTPIAVVEDRVNDSLLHVLIAYDRKIRDHTFKYQGGKYVADQTIEVADYWPGTFLNAVAQDKTYVLFYRKLFTPGAGAICTMTFEDGAWKEGSQAVPGL